LTERWITDSSPLIALAAVGEAHLLTEIPDELIVPEGVAAEVLDGPPEDSARHLVESGFGQRSIPRAIPPRLFAWGLGRGETDALALRLEMGVGTVVIDDLAARKCAAALGVPMMGTLAVVVRAKRLGRIRSAAEIFHALRRVDFRIGDATARKVLEAVGESWTSG